MIIIFNPKFANYFFDRIQYFSIFCNKDVEKQKKFHS